MSSANPNFTIRPAKSVAEASEIWWPLMQELHWNRDSEDAGTHYHVARNGQDWLILTPKDSDEPEGCIVAFTYPNSTGWVGFFIVKEASRGKGAGRELWKGLEAAYQASGTKIIGLDGVKEQVGTYQRRGFVDYARIHVLSRQTDEEELLRLKESLSEADKARIRDVRSFDTKDLARLDLEHTGLDRERLWTQEALFSRADAYGYGITRSAEDQTLTGYVLVRRCEHGHRFGPLYAASYDEAVVLLKRAMSDVARSQGSLIAEVFGSNPEGRKVFEEVGWSYTGLDYHRMWLNGKVPEQQQEGGKGRKGIFAIFDASEG